MTLCHNQFLCQKSENKDELQILKQKGRDVKKKGKSVVLFLLSIWGALVWPIITIYNSPDSRETNTPKKDKSISQVRTCIISVC